MALSVTPAPRTRARTRRSMSSTRPTGSKLVAAFVLARSSLLVLSGRASRNVVCVGHDQHRVHHRCRADVAPAGSANEDAGQRGFLALRRDDTARCPAARPVLDDVATMSTPAEVGRLLGVRQPGSASATQSMGTALVLAGSSGLLGVCGASALLVQSITGPVRRALRVLQAPEGPRVEHRLRLTTRGTLPDTSWALDTAGDGLLAAAREMEADSRSLSTASVGLTATSGTLSCIAEESPTPAGVVSTDAEQPPKVQAVAAGIREIAPDVAETGQVAAETVRGVGTTRTATRRPESSPETRSVLPLIASVVQQAAKAAGAMTATSTPAARSVATTRYTAARSRALGPTTALWHAVEFGRLVGAIDGACETTVCGSLVRVSTGQRWPVAVRDVCPACAALAH